MPASKTSPTICRSSALSAWLLATRSRSSSSDITVRLALGLPPRILTTTSVHTDSSQTSGRASTEIRSRIGAASSDMASTRCSAIRLGASSPRIRVTNVMATVTTANATADDQPDPSPRLFSPRSRKATRVADPYTPETSVARVTPICTEDRKRLGSWASLAAFWPRRPPWESLRIWPSRSETSAISDAAKKPPISTMTRTMTMSPMSWVTLIPGFS